MSLRLKYFSIDEANSLLPKVREVILAARQTKEMIEQKVENWRAKHKNITEAEEAVLRGQVDYLAQSLERQLGEITELGCIPKDLDLGLVDFAARIDGREAYYCWKMGEDKVEYWHGLTEGYAGRKKLEENK